MITTILILSHVLVFVLAAVFFHFENKEEYRRIQAENEKLKLKIKSLKETIKTILDLKTNK